MRMLYITHSETSLMRDNKICNGYTKKINDQIEAFCALGIETAYYSQLKLNNLENVTLWDKIKCRLPYSTVSTELIYSDVINGYDAYYIRFGSADYKLYQFIKKLRKNNSKAKILLEFPNMDCTQMFTHRIVDLPIYWKSQRFLKRTRNIIDRSVTMNGSQRFKYYKNIPIINGIVTERIKVIDNNEQFNYREIHLGIVSGFAVVHGVDILIESLHQYYLNGKESREVFIHLVGTGQEALMEEYDELVKKYHLENYVFFHGYLLNEQLDQIYEKFDIGLCEMAGHRRDYPISSCLKSREYLARGLPIVSSIKNDAMKEGYPYFKLIETFNDRLDMQEIISFYDEVYGNKKLEDIRKEIRQYAQETVEMQITLKPIVDYLKTEDK